SGPALERAPTSIGRRFIDFASSLTIALAAASAPHMSRSHSIGWSIADSSWAAMWWKAATTLASGSSACASSADEPAGGGGNRRGPPDGGGAGVGKQTSPPRPGRGLGGGTPQGVGRERVTRHTPSSGGV